MIENLNKFILEEIIQEIRLMEGIGQDFEVMQNEHGRHCADCNTQSEKLAPKLPTEAKKVYKAMRFIQLSVLSDR